MAKSLVWLVTKIKLPTPVNPEHVREKADEQPVRRMMMNEDVKRVLALEDRLFEMALRYHLSNGHQSYLYECDNRDCVTNREALGDDIFMVKYGQAFPVPAKAQPVGAGSRDA